MRKQVAGWYSRHEFTLSQLAIPLVILGTLAVLQFWLMPRLLGFE